MPFFFSKGPGRPPFVCRANITAKCYWHIYGKQKNVKTKGGGMGLMSVQNDHSVQGWVMTLSVSPTDSSSARFP